ncbi:hypothetical protein RBQ61_07320 [Sedimentibacter sp. MB35-C1]|uniref:DUF6809 family protein n=1 Tax=Sedimentibacter sp. MB35-C1 TaxID=3070995 RepID=UPI0027E1069E|nr:DUF6809 family protein [Sedimentibacter sp. MB35-C1]WMJ78727.1 hypothetical protein RBQ61_07320 [Sedimentibacter sp. MB35-C1]
MQKEKILSELYHGNIRPAEKKIVQGSDYRMAQLKLFNLVEELDKRLNEEEKKMLDEIMSSAKSLYPKRKNDIFAPSHRK